MSYTHPEALVSTEWLAAHLDDPQVRVIDATFHLPTANRDGNAEFLERHIAGAQRFDIDDICAPDTDLPHMLPDAALFARKVAALNAGLAPSATETARKRSPRRRAGTKTRCERRRSPRGSPLRDHDPTRPSLPSCS